MTTWTDDDSQAALAEGWDLFWCANADSPWEIERIDAPADDDRVDYDDPKFSDDREVWVHVTEQAKAGSSLHQKALDFIAEHNPTEWDHIRRWTNSKET